MVEPTERDTRVDAETMESRAARLEDENAALRREVLDARHSLLIHRDHVVGTEAEIGRLNRDILRMQGELVTSRKKIRALQKRKNGLMARTEDLQAKLATARSRTQGMRAELDRHDPAPVPLSSRIARRLRGGRR